MVSGISSADLATSASVSSVSSAASAVVSSAAPAAAVVSVLPLPPHATSDITIAALRSIAPNFLMFFFLPPEITDKISILQAHAC